MSLSTSREITLSALVPIRIMRCKKDVDQSVFEHACQSYLSLNYTYGNDLCQQYEYDFFASFKKIV